MIELTNVTKTYHVYGGERTVLDRISFRIERGRKSASSAGMVLASPLSSASSGEGRSRAAERSLGA